MTRCGDDDDDDDDDDDTTAIESAVTQSRSALEND